MRVYAVVGWNNYYPDVDNVKGGLYTSLDKAKGELEKLKATGDCDHYNIITYDVDDENDD